MRVVLLHTSGRLIDPGGYGQREARHDRPGSSHLGVARVVNDGASIGIL